MSQLALAVLAFVGGHFVLSRQPVRGALVNRIGESAFSAAYSTLMLAAFIWMVGAYRSAPVVPLWDLPSAAQMIPELVMPFSCILMVGSLSVRNPTLLLGSVAATGDPAPGVLKVTRYPMLWAFGLWAVSHLVVSGDLASLLLFGGIAILALGGTIAIDAKRSARDPAGFARLSTRTSNVPLAALVAGRTRMRFGDLGWWRLLLALALFVSLLLAHPLFGGRNLL